MGWLCCLTCLWWVSWYVDWEYHGSSIVVFGIFALVIQSSSCICDLLAGLRSCVMCWCEGVVSCSQTFTCLVYWCLCWCYNGCYCSRWLFNTFLFTCFPLTWRKLCLVTLWLQYVSKNEWFGFLSWRHVVNMWSHDVYDVGGWSWKFECTWLGQKVVVHGNPSHGLVILWSEILFWRCRVGSRC